MVAAQVALLVLLLTSAGLFARTLQKLRSVDAGFRQDHVLVVKRVDRPRVSRSRRPRALRGALCALQRVARRAVGQHDHGYAARRRSRRWAPGIAVPGRPADTEDAPQVYHNFVGPRFFETMGIPVLAGRDFEPGDDERAPKCVVISESVARRYFRGDDPLGRQILFRGVAGVDRRRRERRPVHEPARRRVRS